MPQAGGAAGGAFAGWDWVFADDAVGFDLVDGLRDDIARQHRCLGLRRHDDGAGLGLFVEVFRGDGFRLDAEIGFQAGFGLLGDAVEQPFALGGFAAGFGDGDGDFAIDCRVRFSAERE